ncbi:hypothetical protein N7489_006973 [Penicillium chrysogenum]|uniref:uncharacterized protein n=1 Tax=Penicillium chrysogenum TaxID=5076 RepID=UPI002397518E|nr:uncharacterized protein N7489_006973 [Penicillium chrysogenum]KAJ5236882.1 hypothetical protein N7489_006973 [Penicillium chrysogenum]KAJ5276844.1 hypothetical protein N7524_002997 [Penicillium chrysogenum]
MADSSSWGPKPELIPEVASLFLIVPKTSSVQATRKILPVIHLDTKKTAGVLYDPEDHIWNRQDIDDVLSYPLY